MPKPPTLLYRLTPFATAAARHPIFAVETRHIAWGSSAAALINTSVVRINLIVMVSSVIWLVLAILALLVNSGRVSAMMAVRDLTGAIWTTAEAVGVFGWLVLDFASVNAAMGAINEDVMSGRWDLLKLANIREGHFTVAKHGAAQVRAWKTAMNLIAVRGVALLMAAVYLLMTLLTAESDLSLDRLANLVLIAAILAASLVFAVEPLWRMRAMTAIGLLISARTKSAQMSPLAGFFVVGALWIAQFALLGTVFCGVIGLIFPVLLLVSPLLMMPIVATGGLIGLYALYEGIKNYCLRQVAFRLAGLESRS